LFQGKQVVYLRVVSWDSGYNPRLMGILNKADFKQCVCKPKVYVVWAGAAQAECYADNM
jgi:hypothetical protein